MTASKAYAGRVFVHEIKCGDGNWLLKSPDLPGLLLWGPDLDALRKDIPASIQALFKHNYGMPNVSIVPTVPAHSMSQAMNTPRSRAFTFVREWTMLQPKAA